MKKTGSGKGRKRPAKSRQQKPAQSGLPLHANQPKAMALPPRQPSAEPWQAMPARRTAIDAVLREVLSSSKPIAISELSKKHGVPKELMAEWVSVLERNGLIEVGYSITGAPKAFAPRPQRPAKEERPKGRNPGRPGFLPIENG